MKKLEAKIEEIRNLEVHKIMASLCNEGEELYIIGGFVRDYILGIELSAINDADYRLIGGNPKEFAMRVAHYFGVQPEDLKGNVSAVDIPGFKCCDFPFVPKSAKIEDALARGDFSINTVAIKLNGELAVVDPYNGISDISHKILRQNNPFIYQNKPYTLMRAFRLKHTFGLEFEEESYANLLNSFDFIDDEDVFYIKHNLFYACKKTDKTHEILKDMFNTGFMFKVFPEFANPELARDNPEEYSRVIEYTTEIVKEIDENFELMPETFKNRLNEQLWDYTTQISFVKIAGLLSQLYKIKAFEIEDEIDAKIGFDKLLPPHAFLSRIGVSDDIKTYISNLYLSSFMLEDMDICEEYENIFHKFSMLTGGVSQDALFLNMCKELAKTQDEKKRKEIFEKTYKLVEVLRS